MRAHEIMEDASAGASSSSSIAAVAQPLGAVVRRIYTMPASGKYKNAPDLMGAKKQRKNRAR